MPTEHEGDAIYAPGCSEEERQRLIEQAGFFGGFTERLLVDAGIGPGMRVLDVGCGVGDVSLLVASLVRPEGAVLGVDSNPLALGHARERVSAMGLTDVDFVEETSQHLIGIKIIFPDGPRCGAMRGVIVSEYLHAGDSVF